MIRRLLPTVLCALLFPSVVLAQDEPRAFDITTDDGVVLAAYEYAPSASGDGGYVLLFHQGGGNALGEYGPIVPRLTAEGYRVLAVDLRSGGDLFDESNQTVERLGNAEDDYCAGLQDLEAALRYAVAQRPDRRPIVWGSSYSAALGVQLARAHSEDVAGVLAFSPASGEPMEGCRPEPFADGLTVPLIAFRPGNEAQIPSVAEQLRTLGEMGHEVHVVEPGRHGSSMLVETRVGSDTSPAWALVLDFLRRLETRRTSPQGDPTNAMASPYE